jgi:hypothetical protein
MKYSLRIHSGFTIVEVALAATILLVGFAGMAEALIIGTDMLNTARKQTIAAQIIQSEIEYLRIQPWSTIQGLSSTPPIDSINAISVNSTDTTTPFYYSISGNLKTVASSFIYSLQVADPHPNQLRQVTITVAWVTWKSINGVRTPIPHPRSCNVYIGKYGLNVAYQKQ